MINKFIINNVYISGTCRNTKPNMNEARYSHSPAYYLSSSSGIALQETIDYLIANNELPASDREVLLVNK